MYLKDYKPDESCIYLTIEQACNRANVGKSTLRKLAQEANAVLKIGRIYRVDWKKLQKYLESFAV